MSAYLIIYADKYNCYHSDSEATSVQQDTNEVVNYAVVEVRCKDATLLVNISERED